MGKAEFNSRKMRQGCDRLGMIDGTIDMRITKTIDAVRRRRKTGKLLDLGCSDGSMTMILKEALAVTETHGVEITKEGVVRALEKGIKAVQLDLDTIEKLPYDDNFFDIIYCGELLEHLFDPEHLLDEMRIPVNSATDSDSNHTTCPVKSATL